MWPWDNTTPENTLRPDTAIIGRAVGTTGAIAGGRIGRVDLDEHRECRRSADMMQHEIESMRRHIRDLENYSTRTVTPDTEPTRQQRTTYQNLQRDALPTPTTLTPDRLREMWGDITESGTPSLNNNTDVNRLPGQTTRAERMETNRMNRPVGAPTPLRGNDTHLGYPRFLRTSRGGVIAIGDGNTRIRGAQIVNPDGSLSVFRAAEARVGLEEVVYESGNTESAAVTIRYIPHVPTQVEEDTLVIREEALGFSVGDAMSFNWNGSIAPATGVATVGHTIYAGNISTETRTEEEMEAVDEPEATVDEMARDILEGMRLRSDD